MATSPRGNLIEHLRRTVLLPEEAELTDGTLMESFITRRDQAAFAALVRRHGPMVWGVCRRLLGHEDAEDAFQATFLVLARKAAAVVPTWMLAGWLHGVARQAALHARRSALRRRARERQVAAMPEAGVIDEHPWADLQPLLDEELSRLPDKYRLTLILCDLEGKTRKEAARQLGQPEGTVASRLTRARRMLARRLRQRGVALSGGTLAAVLSRQAASAGVPASVVSSTLEAAALVATGKAASEVIPIKVAALTEGVLKTMLVSKMKTATAILAVLAGVCMGIGVLSFRMPAAGVLLGGEEARVPAEVVTVKGTVEEVKGGRITLQEGTVYEVDARTTYVRKTAGGEVRARLGDLKEGTKVEIQREKGARVATKVILLMAGP